MHRMTGIEEDGLEDLLDKYTLTSQDFKRRLKGLIDRIADRAYGDGWDAALTERKDF